MMNTIKNSMLLLTAATAIFYISGCTQPKASDMLNNDAQKKEIFSAILSNDQASSELMDSMMMKHHDQIMMKMHSMMMGDKSMQEDMMGKMMEMCNTDSSMCKMMMGKTQEHPKGTQTMKDMGMCDMNNMNGKPEEHQQHH